MLSTWNWRIRSPKPVPTKDFDALKQAEVAEQFDQAVENALLEQGCTRDSDPNATELYKYMSVTIQHTIDTVLTTVLRTQGIKREVSETQL